MITMLDEVRMSTGKITQSRILLLRSGTLYSGGWGHEAAQAKRRREAAAADTYAAEGGLGREGANVPVGASGDGESARGLGSGRCSRTDN